ncbi:MAG: extracellular solute-binding protein [Candidatus Kerfeldbacteria bacterium]|nr:extracellular solute-binding protein [Candidatus Kerfeldbacteria bacterium]
MRSPRLIVFFLLLISLSLLGFGCKGGDSGAQQAAAKPIKLNWWRAEGSRNDFAQLIADYQTIHPNVSINYRALRPAELEQSLLEALASGTGPDIVSLPNTYLRAWQERLAPLPPTITLPIMEKSGLIKKETKAVLKTIPTLNLRALRDTFIDVVSEDAVIGGKIYGLPLAVDTLLLFYNRDLLNAADLPMPPATWTDFKEAAQKITRVDKQGKLLQNGAALGEADNVPYAFDLVSSLMLQNGTQMMNATGDAATFQQEVSSQGETFTPGADALRFYTDFANPSKETYAWSREEPSGWQAFATGKVGFTFGYWRDLATLRRMSPQIKLGIANFPQIDNASRPTYYASYYLETVTKQSQNQEAAWDFIQFITKPEQIGKYLVVAKKPTVHRKWVQTQLDDLDLGVPAKQILSARSWYRGLKPKAAENAFLNMIRQVNNGGEIKEALTFAAGQINQTLNSKQ